jgi:tetratricopeptide (TPR) repeat protein
MLTPLYASPEQLRGEPLTIACDVYALGVVLYELLSGERPYEVKAGSAVRLEQAILESDPRAPSRRALSPEAAERRGLTLEALRKALAGDLDAIVLQALAKRPAQRYASAEAMLADIDRWLDGEPVKAHAPSAVYRWGKFVRRNRLAVGLGSASVLALAGVATVAVIQGQQAQRESARAVAARDFMIDMFRRADPEKARGTSITAGELLARGRRDVEDKLQQQPELQAELLQGIATIQSNMGDHTKAAESLVAVERLYRRLGHSHALVLAIGERAYNAGTLGDMNGAAALLSEAQRLAATLSRDPRVNARLAQLGGILAGDRSDTATARALFAEAAEQTAIAFGANDIRTLKALRDIANAASDAGDQDGALRIHTEIMARASANPAVEPRDLAEFAYERVRDLYDAGRIRAAFAAAEPASTDCDRRVGPNAEPCRRLQHTRVQSALRLDWPERALPALASLTALADDPLSPAQQALSAALLVRLLAAVGQVDQVHAWQARLEAIARPGPQAKLTEQYKVAVLLGLADAALRLGDARGALDWSEQALRRAPDDSVSPRTFAWATVLQGIALMELGRHDAALAALQRAGAANVAALGALHPMTLLFSLNEARALALTGRPEEGLRLAQRAEPRVREAFGPDAPVHAKVLRLQAWLAEGGPASSAAKSTVSPSPREPGIGADPRLLFN